MKALLVAVALCGCVDIGTPDVGDPQPDKTAKAPPAVSKCGDAPQMPGWSYTVVAPTTTEAGYARVPEQQWLDHVAWTEAVQQWAACVTAAQ